MKTKTALILGISGQDGSYLADFLLKKKKYKIFISYYLGKIRLIDNF